MTHPEQHNRAQVGRALDYVSDCVKDRADWGKVALESNTSWLMIDVWIKTSPTIPVTMTKPFKAAIWLHTGLAYECDEFGAAGEDPIDLKTWQPRRPT